MSQDHSKNFSQRYVKQKMFSSVTASKTTPDNADAQNSTVYDTIYI